MGTEPEPDGPERAAADLTKSQSSRPDTVNRGPLEEQDVGVFEGEDQHGWAPNVDADRDEADDQS
jgi:hypothetical protein